MTKMSDPYELLDKVVLNHFEALDEQDEIQIVKDTISILCDMGLIDYDILKEWAYDYENEDYDD